MTERQFISVFRSSKKPDTYLYVRRGQVWNDLPEALRALFGEPVHAMDLVMTGERKLARTSGREVLAAIQEKDYYLQMSREADNRLVSFGQTLGKPGA